MNSILEVSEMKWSRRKNKKKEEFEHWFQLKQDISELILIDLKKEWEVGFFPSTHLFKCK